MESRRKIKCFRWDDFISVTINIEVVFCFVLFFFWMEGFAQSIITVINKADK